ncbi:hypothetical protein ANO11243_060230 [Dothideomycetidae sp. 11243]|nr:hypothetical protein ANO11243_060230 [fungal sp. No.11243]
MSDQDRKPFNHNWNNAQQTHPGTYPHDASQSQVLDTISYSSASFNSAQFQALPNFSNPTSDARSRHPVTTTPHVYPTAHVAGFEAGELQGHDMAFVGHRDSVVMPSSSTKPEAISSSRVSDDEKDEDEEDDGSDSDAAIEEEGEDRPLTAAEIRQQKRKMKRFRLSHTQTRYLMGEFARDAHPDAAHRERLSQEIPGLSPRQVQVWFQNRRAKLKRMSAEDRDRMMRSRALPEHFSLAQSSGRSFLQASSSGQSAAGRLLHAPEVSRYADLRPLTLDTAGRTVTSESNYASPTSVTPALGAFSFTPPQSATETQSPISAAGEYGSFGFRSVMGSPRRTLLSPGHSSASSYSSSVPTTLNRVPTVDRQRQSSVDFVPLSLRSNLTPFQAMPAMQQQDRRHSYSQNRASIHRDMGPPSAPVGLGFTLEGTPNYQTLNHQPQHQQTVDSAHMIYRAMSDSATVVPTPSYPSYFEYGGGGGSGGNIGGYAAQQTPQYTHALEGTYGSQLAVTHTPEALQSLAAYQLNPSQYNQPTGGSSSVQRGTQDDEIREVGQPVTSHY